MRRLLVLIVLAASATVWVSAQSAPATGYQLPPKVIVDILDAAPPPTVELSPTRDVIALLERASMPTIAELSQPMLRLAGRRINPRTNGPHRAQVSRSITLKTIADGAEKKVTLPANPALTWVGFSPDGKRFAFTQTRDNGIELWLGDTATGSGKGRHAGATQRVDRHRRASGLAMARRSCAGSCRRRRGAAPPTPTVPDRTEHAGAPRQGRAGSHLPGSAHQRARRSAVRLLRDEPARIRRRGERSAHAGRRPRSLRDVPALARRQLHPRRAACSSPYSWLVPYTNFPSTVEVWDRKGAVGEADRASCRSPTRCRTAACCRDRAAISGSRSSGATVVWAEALDNGDPKAKVPHRDKVMSLAAPFTGAPAEVAQDRISLQRRVVDRQRRAAPHRERSRAAAGRARGSIDKPGAAPRKLWDRSQEDSYSNPGTPQRHERASGGSTVCQAGDSIFLAGQGAAPEGARPFVDRLNLAHAQERAAVPDDRPDATRPSIGVLSDDGSQILTRYESRTEPPNVFVRDLKANDAPRAHQLRRSGAAAAGRAEAARHLQAQRRRRAVGDAHHAAGLDAGARAGCRRCSGPIRASSPIPPTPGR